MSALPMLPSVHECEGWSINAGNQSVGRCSDYPYNYLQATDRATLWASDGNIIDLNTRVSANDILEQAWGISDDGKIIGIMGDGFAYTNTPNRGFLLTPVAPAGSIALNATRFIPGDTLHATIERSGLADLHVAVILPDGVTTLLFTNLETLNYVVGTIATGPYVIASVAA